MAANLTRAVLLFRDGDEQDFPVPDAPEVRLGLAASNDVRLPFEGVSRSHARILRDDKGYWIEDAGSSNGTFLNGQKVVRRRRLEHLDVVRFGRWHRLIFVRKTTPEAPGSRRGIVAAWLESLDVEKGHRRDIPRGAVTLGRSPAANVQADSHLVSKLHARIERTGEQLSVADLHSSNGTFVNGKRVESQVLVDGDELSLAGSVRFRVHIEEGDRPSRDSRVVPLSSPDSKFPFPSDWKTKIEWSPEDLAAMQKEYRDGAAETELSPPKQGAAPKTPGADVPPPAPATSPGIEGLRLEGKKRQVTLGLGDHFVGRNPESALQLEGRSISRRHACRVWMPKAERSSASSRARPIRARSKRCPSDSWPTRS